MSTNFIVKHFESCYKADQLCQRVIYAYPLHLPLVPNSMKTAQLCRFAVMMHLLLDQMKVMKGAE